MNYNNNKNYNNQRNNRSNRSRHNRSRSYNQHNNQHQNQYKNQNQNQYQNQNQNRRRTQNNNNNNNNSYINNNTQSQPNIYNNLKSQALPKRNLVNNNNNANNNNQQQPIDITKSKLNPEIDSFSQLQDGSERLFGQLQQLNSQLIGLARYRDNIIKPRLEIVNRDILIWEIPANSWMLSPVHYPSNNAEYTGLKAERTLLQQQIFENQTAYQQIQQQLEYTRGLYQKLQNEEPVPAVPDYEEMARQNEMAMANQQQQYQNQTQNGFNGNGFNGKETNGMGNDIIDQTPNEETKEVSEPPSVTSSQVHGRYNDSHQRAPSVSSREYDDDNKTMDTESLQSMETVESSNDNEENEEEQDQWETEDEEEEEEEQEQEEEQYDEDDDDNKEEIDEWNSDEAESEQGTVTDTDTVKEEPKEINPGQTRYSVKELVSMQSRFLEIDFKAISYMYKDPEKEDAEEEKIEVPLIAKFISHGVNNVKYMENVVAMFMRKSDNAWVPPSHTGKKATDKKVILRKKLRGILNKMTPEKFAKIAKQTMDVVNKFAENKEMMDIIIEVVLGFAIQIPVFCDQYAKLCQHLKAHLPKLGMVCDFQWILDDPDLSNTFRTTVILQTNNLFKKYRYHSPDNIHLDDDGKQIEDPEELDMKKSKFKQNFFAVMSLAAELFNVDLVNPKVIYRGLFDSLLPPKNRNLSSPDIEGLCEVFKRCGKKLDEQDSRGVDRYLQKLMSHARRFDFRTRVLVDNIKEMRSNRWEARIKKAKATTLDKIKEEHDKQSGPQSGGGRGQGRGRGGYHQQARNTRYHDTYDDEDHMIGIGYNGANQSRSYDNNNNNASRSSSNLGSRSRRRNRNSRYRRANNNNNNGASQSSSNLRSSAGGNGRYGRYNGNNNQSQRPSNPINNGRGNRRLIVEDINDFDDDELDNDNSYSSKKNNENENDNDDVNDEMKKKLNGYISEYLASGVIDDIVDLNCQDINVWACVVNESLRDRRTAEIDNFIDLIVELFKKKLLNNKANKFVNIVIDHLAKETDESSMDCPNFKKYLGKMFAKLFYKGYIKPEACYSLFTNRYKQYSEYIEMGKKKTINKIVQTSIDELEQLKAKQSLISKIKKYLL